MKFLFGWFLLLHTALVNAGEWITLTPQDYNGLQVVQANNSAGQPEGLYISFKNNFTTTSTCTRKNFVVITDSKLIDRALSAVFFATTTNKNINFYIDNPTQCFYHGPQATIITLMP